MLTTPTYTSIESISGSNITYLIFYPKNGWEDSPNPSKKLLNPIKTFAISHFFFKHSQKLSLVCIKLRSGLQCSSASLNNLQKRMQMLIKYDALSLPGSTNERKVNNLSEPAIK